MVAEVQPRVSVVIATKDRSRLLARVLGCIKRQTLPDFEVIVVDDGSSAEVIETYPSIWSDLDERFQLQLQPPGGGPGGTRNAGIRLARGEFVAFCDDDDTWVRDNHLETAITALTRFGGDVFIANMQQSLNGIVVAPDFYGKGGQFLKYRPLDAEATIFDVRKQDLANFLKHRILHANTLIVRRQMVIDMGLYWDGVDVGEDVDFSFRLADMSRRILYCSEVAADGDLTPHSSIMRRHSPEEAAFFVISALTHAQYSVQDPQLRRSARQLRASWMAGLSAMLLVAEKRRSALEFVVESLMISPRLGAFRQLAKIMLSLCK